MWEHWKELPQRTPTPEPFHHPQTPHLHVELWGPRNVPALRRKGNVHSVHPYYPAPLFWKRGAGNPLKKESDLVENGMKRYDSKEWSHFGISSRSEKIVVIFCHDEMTFLYLFYAALYLSQSNMSFVELDMFPCDHVRHSGTLKKQLSFVRLLPFLLSYVQMFEISLWFNTLRMTQGLLAFDFLGQVYIWYARNTDINCQTWITHAMTSDKKRTYLGCWLLYGLLKKLNNSKNTKTPPDHLPFSHAHKTPQCGADLHMLKAFLGQVSPSIPGYPRQCHVSPQRNGKARI